MANNWKVLNESKKSMKESKSSEIYNKLIEQGVPEKILTWNDKADCIYIEIQDYNQSVYKYAKSFFKGYSDVDIDYSNEYTTCIWYNDVSKFSSDEAIRSITDFYFLAKVKKLI